MCKELALIFDMQHLRLDKSFIFSGGEVQVRLPDTDDVATPVSEISIKTKLTSSDAIMEMIMVKNALDIAYPNAYKNLICDYFPYARQDRACYTGEAFSLQAFCMLLKSLNFDTIYTLDLHSRVAYEFLDNIEEYKQYEFFADVVDTETVSLDDVVLVAPDVGALEKTNRIAQDYDLDAFAAYKVRDPENGQILETRIDVDTFDGKNILIIDDICDGGRTFIELAKVLRTKNCGKITLVVSHGIFSKGLDCVFEHVDHIVTSDSFMVADINSSYNIDVIDMVSP